MVAEQLHGDLDNRIIGSMQLGQGVLDGEDKEQVQWAKTQLGKITLTNGAPLELGKELNRPVYFDQAGILCNRFNIEAVPAIIEQDGLLLKISEVKL